MTPLNLRPNESLLGMPFSGYQNLEKHIRLEICSLLFNVIRYGNIVRYRLCERGSNMPRRRFTLECFWSLSHFIRAVAQATRSCVSSLKARSQSQDPSGISDERSCSGIYYVVYKEEFSVWYVHLTKAKHIHKRQPHPLVREEVKTTASRVQLKNFWSWSSWVLAPRRTD
jgi:hypothetical protein